MTEGAPAAASVEALSPFSSPLSTTPTQVRDRDRQRERERERERERRDSMSRSINRTEGYEVVAMPVGGGETESIGGAKERVGSAAKSRSIFGGEVVGAAKDQVTPTPKSRSGSKLGLGGEFISAVKEQFTPTPKNKNVSKLSLDRKSVV